MKEWKNLFISHILERGLNYYENGMVSDLEETENGYAANVNGSEKYRVEIETYNNEVREMFCDCPYAEDGNYCKHMAATLYTIENGIVNTHTSKNLQKRLQESEQELKDVVNKIPEAELRTLMIELACEDKSLRNRLLTTYSEDISEQHMTRLKKEIDEITYQYSDRYGFVDYYNASDYINAINGFMYEKVQTLIDKKHFIQAFELTNYVFYCIGNQDMDDSDSGTTYVADTCYEFWQQILECCQKADKEYMFQWFLSHRNGYVIDYMEDYIEDFLMNEFHNPDMLKRELERLDEIIENAGSSTDCGEIYSVHYGYENNILKRIQLMKELGSSELEIAEYRKTHRQFSVIRNLEIQDYLKENKYNKAIEVLKESKKLDKKNVGLMTEYSRQLIDLYKKTGKMNDYREELEYQVFSCAQNNLQYVNQLKELYNTEEWLQCREKIIASNTAWSIKYDFMVSEELFERLLQEITQNGSIYTLDHYEKVLKKQYPEAVRDAYANYVKRSAEIIADRKNYRELIKYLKKIEKYPDGKKKAEGIAEEWKVIYKRRPAMMDELKKAGY